MPHHRLSQMRVEKTRHSSRQLRLDMRATTTVDSSHRLQQAILLGMTKQPIRNIGTNTIRAMLSSMEHSNSRFRRLCLRVEFLPQPLRWHHKIQRYKWCQPKPHRQHLPMDPKLLLLSSQLIPWLTANSNTTIVSTMLSIQVTISSTMPKILPLQLTTSSTMRSKLPVNLWPRS
jgi:hypothetical protein